MTLGGHLECPSPFALFLSYLGKCFSGLHFSSWHTEGYQNPGEAVQLQAVFERLPQQGSLFLWFEYIVKRDDCTDSTNVKWL